MQHERDIYYNLYCSYQPSSFVILISGSFDYDYTKKKVISSHPIMNILDYEYVTGFWKSNAIPEQPKKNLGLILMFIHIKSRTGL